MSLRPAGTRPRPWSLIGATAGFLVLVACAQPEATAPGESTPEPTVLPSAAPAADVPLAATQDPISGIDVSHFDGAIDWHEVARQDVGFAFIKATEGIDLVHEAFHTNWAAAADADIVRGAYHFYRPEDNPHTQARFFLDTVVHAPGDLPPVLDVEITKDRPKEVIVDGIRVWLEAVEAALGVKPIIYTSPNFWNALDTDAFGAHPLWLAQYQVATPVVPRGWASWTFWQHTQDGTVPGIEKPVDLNHFGGDRDALDALRMK